MIGVNCFPLTILKFSKLENIFFVVVLYFVINLETNNNSHLVKVLYVFPTSFGIINNNCLFKSILLK